ncbi:hypothetical protein C8Q76DRAFT_724590 [Earliella scabrosa]|nr:hypothetical protein C8Q76DRAFT_724590 [Earliella scabrosa]
MRRFRRSLQLVCTAPMVLPMAVGESVEPRACCATARLFREVVSELLPVPVSMYTCNVLEYMDASMRSRIAAWWANVREGT